MEENNIQTMCFCFASLPWASMFILLQLQNQHWHKLYNLMPTLNRAASATTYTLLSRYWTFAKPPLNNSSITVPTSAMHYNSKQQVTMYIYLWYERWFLCICHCLYANSHMGKLMTCWHFLYICPHIILYYHKSIKITHSFTFV